MSVTNEDTGEQEQWWRREQGGPWPLTPALRRQIDIEEAS